jgi:hypothetical protein
MTELENGEYIYAVLETAIEKEVESLYSAKTEQKLSEGIDQCYAKLMQINNSSLVQVLERLLQNLQPGQQTQENYLTQTVQTQRGINTISGF